MKGCAHITSPFSADDVLICVHDIAARIITADITDVSVSSVALLVKFYTRSTTDLFIR
jgi:hypothetical protein